MNSFIGLPNTVYTTCLLLKINTNILKLIKIHSLFHISVENAHLEVEKICKPESVYSTCST